MKSKELQLTDADLARFWAKVVKTDECWEWVASVDGKGYGLFFVKLERRHLMKSHRIGYAQAKGEIPPGLVIDHLCRNRKCCRPDHLEAVTNLENSRRGVQRCSKITHCPQGHEYNAANTYRYKNERHCKPCQRRRTEVFRRKALPVSRSTISV